MRATNFIAAGLLLLTSVGLAADPARPGAVGHRGLVQAAPENTLAAFRACLQLRVGFEFDVRRTRDGKLVCVHDAALDRTTSGRGELASATLAELRALDAGSWFDPAFAGARVPTIDEILTLIAQSPRAVAPIAVDLKAAGEGLEQAIVAAAAEREILDRLLFIGLAIESAEIRGRLKAASRAAQTARLAPSEAAIADVLADPDADWVYVRILPNADTVRKIHAAGKRVFIAGPLVAGQESENWQQTAELGFDAVLTDYPLEFTRQMRAGRTRAREAGALR